MNKEVRLKSISRGFGGDNAVYKGDGIEIMVCVGWALLSPHMTHVFIDGKEIAKFEDQEYIQPHVALARLGYTVSGAVDFAASTCPVEEMTG